MKANSPKRKIFDAVDMLTEESSAHEPDGVQVLPLNKIMHSMTIRSSCMRVSDFRTWWRA